MSTAEYTKIPIRQYEASQTTAPTYDDTVNPSLNKSAASPNHHLDEPLQRNQSSSILSSRRDQLSESTTPSTPEDSRSTRQVIAVSASKGPAAFFNLSRKFLVTDEEIDLSALEGAIVSAVDAAHLLERSKLATIVRVQTSYVSVEPKRRKVAIQPMVESPSMANTGGPLQQQINPADPSSPDTFSQNVSMRFRSSTTSQSGRELRRSRIIITMRRTNSYKQWLEDNPLQAIAAGQEGDDDDDDTVKEGRIE
ncbi:hypothetical protein MPSEU_000520000 [Mayamaea pseudoterrestris]|nr:hypothetical protein MPSEU_000520000 [Mayamaea pseudoterrestris]